jgi:hypothetical protein
MIMNMDTYRKTQAKAEREFVGDTLFEALDMLAMRRGQPLELLAESGRAVTCSDTDETSDLEKHVSFRAEYMRYEDGMSGFMYDVSKSEATEYDFLSLDKAQQLGIIKILEADDVECGPEVATGLLKCLQLYADPEQTEIEEMICRYQYSFRCRADQLSSNMTVERSMETYFDNKLIAVTSIGDVELEDVNDGDEQESEDSAPEGELMLSEGAELIADLSTSTPEDLDELHDVLQTLGLERRPKSTI